MSPHTQSYEEIAVPQCMLHILFINSRLYSNDLNRSFPRFDFCNSSSKEVSRRYFINNDSYSCFAKSWSPGLLGQSRFSGDIPDIARCFDNTTKLRFRNADEPQYIKFGSIRDKDPTLNIRSGQLKLLGYASNIISRPSMYYCLFLVPTLPPFSNLLSNVLWSLSNNNAKPPSLKIQWEICKVWSHSTDQPAQSLFSLWEVLLPVIGCIKIWKRQLLLKALMSAVLIAMCASLSSFEGTVLIWNYSSATKLLLMAPYPSTLITWIFCIPFLRRNPSCITWGMFFFYPLWPPPPHDVYHKIVSILHAVRQPLSIPLSLASLNIVTRTTTSFTHTLFTLKNDTDSIAETLAAVRQLYEIAKIPNRVKVVHHPEGQSVKNSSETSNQDPDDPLLGIPFPEDQQSLELGISVEFCQVSFKYPGSHTYALQNSSFKIGRGQLCVIVGNNGSGKSTILKLIARLYDPVEGEIQINSLDIRTLRLADLRNAITVLFQDYTVFPLNVCSFPFCRSYALSFLLKFCMNIRDNISLGDPPHSSDFARVQKAAELAGADTFIDRLPDKYDTYLERPVMDQYSSLPEGTTTTLGHKIDYQAVREAGGIHNSGMGLSARQMQRIALYVFCSWVDGWTYSSIRSQTFMHLVVSHGGPGLLLFDEPSASLDPTTEHREPPYPSYYL